MGWIIAAAIVLFFVLLLAGRATVILDYNGELALKIKYLCFTIVKLPSRKKKKASPKKKKKKPKKTDESKKKKKLDLKSLTFDDILELLKTALSGAGKMLRKLFKRIEISHMSINIVCGGEDAAKAAIKFGAMNIAAGNLLGLLDSFLTLKPLDDMNITVDFHSEKTLYDIYFEGRMPLFAAFAAGFGAVGVLIRLVRGYNKKTEQNKKSKVN